MRQKFRLCSMLATALVCMSWGMLRAQAQAIIQFDIPAQSLADSLRAVGGKTHTDILFDPLLVAGRTAPALKGELTTDAALSRLLAGSGLKHRFLNETTVVLAAAGAARSSWLQRPAGADPEPPPQEGQGNSSGALRVAQADGATTAQPAVLSNTTSSASSGSANDVKLEEVVVTAQKRLERLQDVPVPVTALNAQTLIDSNQLRFQDYYTRVPGLDFTTDSRGAPVLAIRGLTTSAAANQTVSETVDDVPYGASTSLAFSWMGTDIDPNELARVEVLRGPQGTLYGASSLGGLIKFVTIDPSTDAVTGRLQAGASDVSHGAQAGYNVSGAINIPLSDTWAIRASGFARRDPGYIDDPTLHAKDVNWGDADGGRISALWRPSQEFSLKLDALAQESKTHGYPYADIEPGFAELQQSEIRGSGGQDRRVWAFDAIIKAKLGAADLTSVTGYNINRWTGTFDNSFTFGPFVSQFGSSNTLWFEDNQTGKVSQELRLSVPLAANLDWLVGAFYTHESTDLDPNILAADPDTGAAVGTFFHGVAQATYEEYAGFTDLTYRVTDRFDVQFGGRESTNRQTYHETDFGPYDLTFYGTPSPYAFPAEESRKSAFTYLVTPRFKVTPDLMLYARLASGYRPGGPNEPTSNRNVPASFGPDKTMNYEIGAKGTALENRLSFDASVYYIDWKDIQVLVYDPNTEITYFTNANRAKSQGVELSVESRPLSGLTLGAWVAWNDAELTKAFPPVDVSFTYGVPGDRLPYSSRFSGNFSAEQSFPLSKDWTGLVGVAVSYVGERVGEFAITPARDIFPAYTRTDLRGGLKRGSWAVNLFANNITDRRGIVSGGIASGGNSPFAYQYIQPRTVGFSIAKTFGP